MKTKDNKNITTNKILLHKIKLEGRGADNNIEKILSFKKPKALTINPKLLDNKKNFDPEDDKNRAYNEALRIIQQFKNDFKNNIKNYNLKKDENNNFIKGYKRYKKINKKLNIEEIDKKAYVFGKLINAYNKKGIQIPFKFFYNDIYKDSGLLLCKRSKMDEYFEEDIKKNGEKSEKSLKFLKKLSREVQKVFNKRLLNMKYKNKESKSMSYENDEDNMNNQVKNRIKMKKKDYFNFFEKVNVNVKQISKQQKEIEKLKELISKEENKNCLFQNKKYNNSMSNIYNNSDIYIESHNNYSKNSRKINTYKSYDILNQQNISNNNSNSFNNNELYTSSTMIPKNNSISIRSKIMENLKKNNLENISHFNLGSSSFDENNNTNNQNYKNKNISNDTKNNDSNNNISQENEKKRISVGNPARRRTSSFNIINFNKQKIVPPIYLNRLNNRRKSFLPITNYNNLNKINNIITVNNRNSNKSETIHTNKSINSISMRKVNSQPNLNKSKTSVKDMYESITKIRFHPFKKFKNGEKINNIYKNYYGDKLKNYDKNINNDKDLLKNYYNIKGQIIQSESNNDIYYRYKELLPNIMVNNIRKNKEQNEILKEHPFYFAKMIYEKRYIEPSNKKDKFLNLNE